MAKKPEVTQERLDRLADTVQEVSFEVAMVAGAMMKQIISDVSIREAAPKFNQMIEACAGMNRALLAIQRHREDCAELKERLSSEATKALA